MKWLLILLVLLISCIASNMSSSGAHRVVYIDGCYYVITDGGGITAKVNQPSGCRE